jgi:hypothetical protein
VHEDYRYAVVYENPECAIRLFRNGNEILSQCRAL